MCLGSLMREHPTTKQTNLDQRIRTKEKRDLKEKNRFKKDKADLKGACMKLLWRKSKEDRIDPS